MPNLDPVQTVALVVLFAALAATGPFIWLLVRALRRVGRED